MVNVAAAEHLKIIVITARMYVVLKESVTYFKPSRCVFWWGILHVVTCNLNMHVCSAMKLNP